MGYDLIHPGPKDPADQLKSAQVSAENSNLDTGQGTALEQCSGKKNHSGDSGMYPYQRTPSWEIPI